MCRRVRPAVCYSPPPCRGTWSTARVWATVLRAVTAAKPTASASAILIMLSERAYDFDALHPVAISNAGEDQSALLNHLRERALASVDNPNTTLPIFEWSARMAAP